MYQKINNSVIPRQLSRLS